MLPFLSGAIMLGSFVAGIFFFRFWRKTHDSLFWMFGVAFFLLAIERLVLAFLRQGQGEEHTFVYLIRLAAFLLILVAIANKNRQERK